MQSISPVFAEEHVPTERVIALDQPEYLPIIILPLTCRILSKDEDQPEVISDAMMAVRFRLSDEEREAVAAGADLIVTEMTLGEQFTPIALQFCAEDEYPNLIVPSEK